MERITIIGDVHGKVLGYEKIIRNCDKSIQVGDFGFQREHDWHVANIDPLRHKINFGNHDDTRYLDYPYSMGNWSWDPVSGIMTIRGADSIDRSRRKEGLDWFPNEQLSYTEMSDIIDTYILYKPRILITHDCPQSLCTELFHIRDKTLTRSGLQTMLDMHQPELWIFGHHHRSRNIQWNGTRFICLAECETFIID